MSRESEPIRPPAVEAALKEAAIAALIAFGLFALMVGIKTDQGPTSALVITTRFGAVAALVAVTFVGRFLLALARRRTHRPLNGVLPRLFKAVVAGISPYAAAVFLIAALFVPIVCYGNRYWLDLAILIVTYTMLGSASRLPASSPRSPASCLASQYCGCAATISPSSRSASAKSSG